MCLVEEIDIAAADAGRGSIDDGAGDADAAPSASSNDAAAAVGGDGATESVNGVAAVLAGDGKGYPGTAGAGDGVIDIAAAAVVAAAAPDAGVVVGE